MTDANTICHDLDLLDDWLAGKGYGEEAGLVLRALSLIHKQARENEKLRELLAEGHAALSWTLLEGMDECIPTTLPVEYKYVVNVTEAIAAALKETGNDV